MKGSQEKMLAVLTVEPRYFRIPTMNNIVGGTFRVFGKTTKVIPPGIEDSIDLMGHTVFAYFDRSFFDHRKGLLESVLSGDNVLSKVEGPTLQVLPISIFS